MYDVIIVGAGPTGSIAAKILSENRYKVLLIEKFKIPRYKSCSGVLIKKTMELVQANFKEEIPISTTCTPIENKGMVFTDDNGKEYVFEQPGLNVWRSSFDHWLTERALTCGTIFNDNTTAISCEEQRNHITLTLRSGNRTYYENARYVIDCEGVVGTLKRKLKKETPSYITTYQTFNRGQIDLDPHYFYAYLQPALSEYDAWFNVKDDLLLLGVSVKKPQQIPTYYNSFISYMENKHNLKIFEQQKAEKWLMPLIAPGCHIDYGVGRVLFAGEIAGFLNPMGEGISAGLESGYHAAHSIMNNFDNIDKLYDDYKKGTEDLKIYMKRQWAFVAQISPKFSRMK